MYICSMNDLTVIVHETHPTHPIVVVCATEHHRDRRCDVVDAVDPRSLRRSHRHPLRLPPTFPHRPPRRTVH